MKGPERKYSPGICTGARKKVIEGDPARAMISTSHAERHNLTMRMSMRRLTRLPNAFSKKIENHWHVAALYGVYYNFVRIHKSLWVTPAMESGLVAYSWSMRDIIKLIDDARPVMKRGPYKKRISN